MTSTLPLQFAFAMLAGWVNGFLMAASSHARCFLRVHGSPFWARLRAVDFVCSGVAGVTGELPKEAKEYVDIALSNSDRLVRLINDILDIEKMQSGSMEFRMRAVELAGAIRSSIAANDAFAASHGVRLVLAEPVPAGEVLVDPDRLAQVLANLVSNAAKFSPKDGVVEVSVQESDDRVRVSVRDHGPGIPEEFRGRIFQRFAQADASSTRQKGLYSKLPEQDSNLRHGG